MQGTVQEFTKNQNGRTKVKIDGLWYNVGNDCDLDGTAVMIGERIQFDASNNPFKGKDVWWLNKYVKLPNGAPKVGTAIPTDGPPSLHPYVAPNGPPSLHPYVAPTAGSSLDEPTLRFISNCVGQAIAAKTLVDPCDIEIWVSAARNAIRGQS